MLRGSVLDRYRELDERVGFGLPGDVPVSSLRLADQQKVEIMRALARNARLIVLDEPTSSLSRDESQRLQQLMRDLRSHGRTLVYVSHFLDEVLAVADTVTIMRDGRITRTAPAADETKDSLVLGMLGRQLEVNFPAAPPVAADAPVVLEARALCGQVPRDVDLQVRAGEIVGLAGLVGSGRTELARMIAGADPITSGELLLDGVVLPRLRPHGAIRRGVVMLPEDRRALGLVMTQNVRENVTLPRLPRFRRNGAVRIGAERSAVRSVIDQLHIVPPDPDGALRNYSGGNQQKTLFGKWTLERPRCIVLDEPTRGVDIGAKRSHLRSDRRRRPRRHRRRADLLRARGGARHGPPHAADERRSGHRRGGRRRARRRPGAGADLRRHRPLRHSGRGGGLMTLEPAGGAPVPAPSPTPTSTGARSGWRAPPTSAVATAC